MQDVLIDALTSPEVIGAIAGALGGGLRAVIGWLKSKDKFSVQKTLKPIGLGIVAGLIAGFSIRDANLAFAAGMTLAQTGSLILPDEAKVAAKKPE